MQRHLELFEQSQEMVLCFSPWTMLFRVSFKVPLSFPYSAVISAWKNIIELSDTPRPR